MQRSIIYPRIIEVVVVIVIVAVIAAVLFPVFAVAHQPHGNHHSCSSDMQQFSLALVQYNQDYDGRWPDGADHWAGQLYPYLKSQTVFQCPDDYWVTPAGKYVCSYAFSSNLPGHTVSALTNEADTVAMTEIDGTPALDMTKPERISLYTDGATPNTAWGGSRMGTPAPLVCPTRHDPYLMFLACDGHVMLLPPRQVSSGRDSLAASRPQDGIHAAGTAALGTACMLTFSER